MIRAFFAVATAAMACAAIPAAEAKPWDPTQSQGWQQQELAPRSKAKRVSAQRMVRAEVGYQNSYAGSGRTYSAGPRPRKWCGWWMRTQKGGGPEFNVAWNWRKYGRALSGPQVGAVVVWRGHVGMIVGRADNGKWIVKSGNDGGKVRTRARSVSGAVFRI